VRDETFLSSWQQCRFDSVARVISGKNQRDVECPSGPYPIYGSGGAFGKSTGYLCEAGTIVIGRKGTINSPIFVNERFWNVDTAFGLCPIDSNALLPLFLYYFCRGFNFAKLDKSTTIPSLAKRDIEAINFPLPPLAEQKRILAKIEELFSELDAGEESLRVARRQLGVYRQSLLKQAFEGKLNGGWRTLKVGEIGRIETGTTPPTANPKNYDGDLPFFKPTDLEQGRFVRKAREHLSEAGQEHARILPKGSVLVTCIGATIGKTGLSQLPCATNQQINSISPNDEVLPEFAYYQVISPRFQEQIKTNASSTTLPILNKSKFCVLPFVVCSLPEQHEIIRLLDEQFEVIERNEREIDAALRRSEALRQAILKKAFTGQLVPQDPDDEPARVLLARLRAQKQPEPIRQSKKNA
jgi:type I restriction enzyme S subunit